MQQLHCMSCNAVYISVWTLKGAALYLGHGSLCVFHCYECCLQLLLLPVRIDCIAVSFLHYWHSGILFLLLAPPP